MADDNAAYAPATGSLDSSAAGNPGGNNPGAGNPSQGAAGITTGGDPADLGRGYSTQSSSGPDATQAIGAGGLSSTGLRDLSDVAEEDAARILGGSAEDEGLASRDSRDDTVTVGGTAGHRAA